MRPSPAAFVLALIATLDLSASVAAQQVPTGIVVDTLVSSGLIAPNDFCFLPDGRILIANRTGGVTVYANGSTANIGTVPNVETGNERGLLSICPDPAFPQNGYVYVWYSSTLDAFMHLDRFTCTGDLGNASSTNLSLGVSSRRVVIGSAPDNAFNHNGGTVRFGPDGKLFLSIGDDATSCAAQSVSSLQGVLLRMDVGGLAAGGSTTAPTPAQLDPGDNPLSANTDFSQLVIAYGLRNPFRFEIDPATNNIYIGDVGQNAWEEYSEYVYVQGALQLVNFGWPWREAASNFSSCTGGLPPGLVDPIASISQGQGWRSVIGGTRYRNQSGQFDFGAAYEGSAFYGDYFSGHIRRLVNQGGVWSPAPAVPGQPSAANWAQGFVAFTSLQTGPEGGLYILAHPSTYATSGGSLKRIRPLGPVNGVIAISGGNQIGPALEPYSRPIVAQVRDPQGSPIAGGLVNFAVLGPVSLSTTNPVVADSNGMVQTMATATNGGGTITVTATTPGNPAGATFTLFSRKMSVISTSNLVIIQVSNLTSAVPASVPFIVMASAPGIPSLPTPFGPICTDPFNPFTFVIEDSIGLFGFTSLSGTGARGTPGLTKIYNVPPGALTGVTLNFQAVGLDPIVGAFRTNCERKTL